ncbi:MAG: cyclic nucleotide-binding domain-containing protein [Myxococcaceae bacterium]|nr:cyclic nucleotide-binding domain-containing protein [Myxococcaceae bacterium]MCI0672563.1 cyclic nucleotide-binding domain-containing protein [Myxococcaceae bacterium]
MSSVPEAALWAPPVLAGSRKQDVLQVLEGVPLFAELTAWQLRKVARLLHERTYQPGEVVFREGDPGAGMYVLARGAVRIVQRLPDGAERELAHLSAGHFFGEMALLESAPRSASCVAVEPTTLLGFFEPDLEALVERDSRLGARILWNLAQLMASRLRATNEAASARAGEGR